MKKMDVVLPAEYKPRDTKHFEKEIYITERIRQADEANNRRWDIRALKIIICNAYHTNAMALTVIEL